MSQVATQATAPARVYSLPNRPTFMLAADVAKALGMTTKRIVEVAKRNPDIFDDASSAFELTAGEVEEIRSQIATERPDWSQIATELDGRSSPIAFTFFGVMMLAACMNSARARAAAKAIGSLFVRETGRQIEELRFLLTKAGGDRLAKRPRMARIKHAADRGLDFKQIVPIGRMSRQGLAIALRDLYHIELIPRLPLGTPEIDVLDASGSDQLQLPLFGK